VNLVQKVTKSLYVTKRNNPDFFSNNSYKPVDNSKSLIYKEKKNSTKNAQKIDK